MKLASIERIVEIQPIPNADRIVAAKVLGYWTVVQKEGAAVGNLVVWHSPDTIVKEDARYSFLQKHNYRLKVSRFKKQTSQGLALPLIDFPELSAVDPIEGTDVSAAIGITKYEKQIPAELAGKMRGHLPAWLRKTDEENLRSNPGVLEELHGKQVVITTKLDGSSSSFAIREGEFHVCSRRIDLLEDENNVFWKMAHKYGLKDKLNSLAYDIAVQGEVYGTGLNGNHLGLPDVQFAAFNLFDIIGRKYYGYDQMMMICKDLGIPTVPVVYRGVCDFTLDDLIKLANEQKYPNGKAAEGIVIRTVEEDYSRVLDGRLSVKVISENYALEHGE